MVDISANITEFRRSSGYTQKELAEKLGISAQTVSKWEKGISAPDISMLPLLASVFSITVDMLLGCYKGTDRVTPETAYAEITEMLIARVRMFYVKGQRPESTDERRKCVDAIKSLLQEHPSWETGIGLFDEKAMYYSPDMGFVGIDDVGKKLFDENVGELFEFLSDKVSRNVIEVIFAFGYEKYMSLEYIAEKAGAEMGDVRRCMDFLCRKSAVTKTFFPVEGERIVEAYKVPRSEGTRGFIMLRAIAAFANKFEQKSEFLVSYIG